MPLYDAEGTIYGLLCCPEDYKDMANGVTRSVMVLAGDLDGGESARQRGDYNCARFGVGMGNGSNVSDFDQWMDAWLMSAEGTFHSGEGRKGEARLGCLFGKLSRVPDDGERRM